VGPRDPSVGALPGRRSRACEGAQVQPETERVSLGLKQMMEDPWTHAQAKYPPGTVVRGKVVSLKDYGAFIEIEQGIEGLIHISEMSWTRRVKHPSKMLAIGDTVEAVVLDIDPTQNRISLGMKQLSPTRSRRSKRNIRPGPWSRASCATSPTSVSSWRSKRASTAWCTCPTSPDPAGEAPVRALPEGRRGRGSRPQHRV